MSEDKWALSGLLKLTDITILEKYAGSFVLLVRGEELPLKLGFLQNYNDDFYVIFKEGEIELCFCKDNFTVDEEQNKVYLLCRLPTTMNELFDQLREEFSGP